MFNLWEVHAREKEREKREKRQKKNNNDIKVSGNRKRKKYEQLKLIEKGSEKGKDERRKRICWIETGVR